MEQQRPLSPSPEADLPDDSSLPAAPTPTSVGSDKNDDRNDNKSDDDKSDDGQSDGGEGGRDKSDDDKSDDDKRDDDKSDDSKSDDGKSDDDRNDKDIALTSGAEEERENVEEERENAKEEKENAEEEKENVEEEKENAEDTEALSEGEFVVEAIRADRKHRGVIQYQIKWKGYSEAENTWENEANVNADELVSEYLRKKAEKSLTSNPRKRPANDSTRSAHENMTGRNANKRRTMLPKEDNKPQKSDTGRGKTKPSEDTKESSRKRNKSANTNTGKGRSKETWRPPTNLASWEDAVIDIESIEQSENGGLIMFLNWDNGHCTAHKSTIANKMCPQKVIKFYEDHLRFRTVE